ncbi:flagellar hook assembly protein FlgD [Bdellovibrio bacteriovorus]|uniref:Basal-body rod modification protein FlgD n=1 Tax=Bdellovibrio bacteriovorus str. Tiberius TaxID=1069642 RepID=K7ZC87_BDEBC|nr:flagellar hook capping FlgD N-terminal domain-containing protein [Bdellovibrio bacteriovorus]AFY02989.1 basal-body rod modification protein flgD [Bdellovibrio bacteriovorus str. Tiberius]
MTMVNAKLGVNAFGATQTKPETAGASNMSVADREKLGGENVGEVLNKIVDANWTDPSKKTRAVGNPSLDKDAFFKLMLTQMKNQDPTNPLKSHEMAAQLASFSSLEQMQNMNKSLDEMKNGQKPSENFQALNLIGKAVAGDSSKVVRGTNDREHDFKFTLPMAASEVSVKVRDAEGNVVRTYNLKSLKAGENKLTWNGEDEKAMKALPGEYQFIAEAKTADGKKMGIKTDFDGMITGVSYSNEGPVLHVGNQAIRFSDVKKITDPRLMTTDQKVNDVTNLDLKKDDAKGQTMKEGNAELQNSSMNPAPVAKSNIMNNVGLSRDMMEKIAKETAK